MNRLKGKTAIVTGSAQGIGATLALALAGEGANVVVTDILDTATCVGAIKAVGGRAIGMKVDVTDRSSLDRMITETEAAFGPIEILINNAGLFANLALKPFWEIDDAEFDKVMTVNVRGVFQSTKAVLPSFKKNGRGKIVNISSGTFFYGAPGFAHYVASKGAVIGLTRSMARELGGQNITVNAVTPGLTESEGVKTHAQLGAARAPTLAGRAIQRDMTPDDLIGAIVFLCTPDSDFVTGQTINVDGGRLMW